MKELSTYNRAAGYLNKIFDLLNHDFFEGALSRPTITIQSTPRPTGIFPCGMIVEHHDKYGWSITSPSDRLLDFILEHDLTDILINRNESYGIRVPGTGTHNGTGTMSTGGKRLSSTRKYVCPCCGNSVRATKNVNIGCLDCMETMYLAV